MNPTSISDFSLQAARRYIQSAVFIDDNIYNQTTANLDDVAKVEIKQPKVVLQPDTAEEKKLLKAGETGENPSIDVKQPFRTKDLVGAFAEHSIVCALYEPEKNFSTDENSTVFKLCQTAYLVILDWDFDEVGVKGTKPKSLIEKLINSGNRVAPHHVRLIAIYTNTQSLLSIANSIFQHLQATQIHVEPIAGCSLRLQAGAARIIVLGKAGGVDRVAEEKTFTVREIDLAERLLMEFASMNQGILPSCALLGMAAVRHNSRRILDKFRSDLDGQFLLNRALIRSSEEAFDQLPELLGDEFKAVIEDSDFRPDDATKFVRESCLDVPVKPHSTPWLVNGQNCEIVLKDFWIQDNDLLKPLNGKKANTNDGDQPKRAAESLATMCSVNDGEAHQRFAALLAVRTQYQVNHRYLGFGVIVFDRSSQKYGVCIMPSCDSLRLRAPTAFPFWKLGTSGRGNPVILQRENGQLLKLVFEAGKPSGYMWMATFVPDPAKCVITANSDASGKHVFRSTDAEFEWVAQLKPTHAQRIANAIGQQLSRVGLTEAEWARITFAAE